mgnify:CR=1 FL=1
MAKHASRQSAAAAGLFGDPVPVARQRLAAASLQRDITRFQQQLDSPLASWEQKDHQVIEANVALSFTLRSLAEFLPADLQPLVAQFIDLRAQLVLREFLDSDDLP